jgi:hypothetical protein
MALDLGGIAKGYAAEAALAVLAQRGIPSAMIAARAATTVRLRALEGAVGADDMLASSLDG